MEGAEHAILVKLRDTSFFLDYCPQAKDRMAILLIMLSTHLLLPGRWFGKDTFSPHVFYCPADGSEKILDPGIIPMTVSCEPISDHDASKSTQYPDQIEVDSRRKTNATTNHLKHGMA